VLNDEVPVRDSGRARDGAHARRADLHAGGSSVWFRADRDRDSRANVVGFRMDRATRTLRSRGFRVNEESSGIFGCIVKSRWWVCEQDPRPGKPLPRYAIVVIYAERRDEC
jgi:hypothetical protein